MREWVFCSHVFHKNLFIKIIQSIGEQTFTYNINIQSYSLLWQMCYSTLI